MSINDNNAESELITPDLDKVKSLISKVRELAERGVEGERNSAQDKLELLLKKYGLKLKDIEKENRLKRTFRISNKDDCITIITQTIWDVAPKTEIKQHNRKLEIYCNLTAEQYLEVCEKFEYYWKLYQQEKKEFTVAFVIKNKLGTDGHSGDTEINEETKQGIKKKMDGITKGQFVNKNTKQLK